MLLTIEAIVLSLCGLGLLRLRQKYDLVPFYMYVATLFIYSDIVAGVMLNKFLDWNFTSGSAGPFVMSLLALIWVIEVKGAEEARKYVYGIVLTKLLIILAIAFFLIKSAYAISDVSPLSRDEIFAIFGMNPCIVFASVIAFVVDMFLLAFLYTFFSIKFPLNTAKLRMQKLFLRAFVPLLLTLYADSIIFVTISSVGTPLYFGKLAGHFVAKTYFAFLFAIFFTSTYTYLPFDDKRKAEKEMLDESRSNIGSAPVED